MSRLRSRHHAAVPPGRPDWVPGPSARLGLAECPARRGVAHLDAGREGVDQGLVEHGTSWVRHAQPRTDHLDSRQPGVGEHLGHGFPVPPGDHGAGTQDPCGVLGGGLERLSGLVVASAGESLLIVEDDLFVRDSLAHVLHELGYKVSTAVNIDLALKYLRTGLQVDLVMVDVRQTYGAAALDMADALAAEGMRLPILLTGSSTSANFSATAATGPSAGVLCKPFSIYELSLKIRQILHSEDQTANTF